MRFAQLQDWLSWQSSLHPASIELGLERLRPAWLALRKSPLAKQVITVAGTNGKGSTIATLEAILLAAGYRVGSYTSPHIHRYNERIRIQGIEASDTTICEAFEAVDQAREGTSLTYFEFGTLAAFSIFQQAELDVVLLETGLGGRLDAVNIIDPDIAVITSIDLDHQDWLGDTREAIAEEKFGIARQDKPLIIGDPNPPERLLDLAQDLGAQMSRFGLDYGYEDEGGHWSWWNREQRIPALPRLNLPGRHQLNNAATALQALNQINASLPVSRADLRRGLAAVEISGRFQVVRNSRTTIFDVAHNPQAAFALAENVRGLPPTGKRIAVMAMLADKDIAGVLEPLLSLIDHWHIADLNVERGATASRLAEQLKRIKADARIACYASVAEAKAGAERQSVADDYILVFGSFYTVAEAMPGAEQNA